MAASAFVLLVPQLVFVQLMQHAIKRRAGARVWVLRQLGASTADTADATAEHDRSDSRRDQPCAAAQHGHLQTQILDEFPDESVQPQAALIIRRMRAAPASVAIKGGEVRPPSRQRVERPICDPKLIQIIKVPGVAEAR